MSDIREDAKRFGVDLGFDPDEEKDAARVTWAVYEAARTMAEATASYIEDEHERELAIIRGVAMFSLAALGTAIEMGIIRQEEVE